MTTRIMFIVTSLYMGGQERKLLDIINNLDPSKYECEICCTKEPGPLAEDAKESGVTVHSKLLSSKYDIRVLPRMISLLKKQNIQIAYTVGAGDNMFWGRLAAKLAGVPLIFSSLHKMWDKDKDKSTVGYLNKLLIPYTDKIIAVGEKAKKFLVEFEKIDQSKIEVICNGVDVDLYPSKNKEKVRQELSIPADALVVGIVASLRTEKGHAVFLEAAEKVRAVFDNVNFIICGDGSEKEFINKKIKKLGLSGAVHMLGMRRDVPEIMAALDVLVLASYPYVETFPNVVLEAMASQKPVVATNVGCITEIVTEGETGRIVPVNDPASMAEAIISILKNRGSRKRMGTKAREIVCEKFTLDKMVKQREALFERFLKIKDLLPG